ncbi:MAG: methyltransferase domain-containing protein [Chitinispirillaceae bacterium]|jgi:cyclopropane fatty-acyl-phospholipid synthase-like methyltransferase
MRDKKSRFDIHEFFCSYVVQHVHRNATVVDVGAGAGLCKQVNVIRVAVGRLIGVDPNPNIYENYQVHEVMNVYFEDCTIDKESVDLIYSIFVAEHIERPDVFFKKAVYILKANGKMLFLTPNKYHYFFCLSKLADKINMKKYWIEKIMHSTVNRSYGFPTYYLINEASAVRRLADKCGFKRVQFVYIDCPEVIAIYFPKCCRWIPSFISTIMKTIKIPERYYSNFIAELTK